MNIQILEEAIERQVPFFLRTADGERFDVPHPDYIFLPPKSSKLRTYAAIHREGGYVSVLPLLTITSLTFQTDID